MGIVVGRKPVLEALFANEKIDHIFILIGQKGSAIDEILKISQKRNINCTFVKKEKFDSLSDYPTTQGVIAQKPNQKNYSLDEIIQESKSKEFPLLLLLDSIQDPHNLGAIIRSAECAGVDGIIVTKHNSAPLNETVAKTSAGALEYVKICTVNNLVQAIELIKKAGFWVFGASLANSKKYSDVNYKLPVAIVLGNEEKGIRPLTASKCDVIIKIPMAGKIDSLNVSVASGVILFEIRRQRFNEKL